MSERFLNYIKTYAHTKGALLVVPFKLCRDAAVRFELSPRAAEALALRAGLCPSRYVRNIGVIGMEGQARLLESAAAVVGCGGLGGWIVEMLARAGVGRLILIDGDAFDDNNLNRQLYCDEENIGASKAEAAAARVRRVNGAVEAVARPLYINEENGRELLAGADAAVDALDGNDARGALFKACRELDIPFVHGAVGGFYGEAAVLAPQDRPVWELTGAPDRGIELSTGNPPFIPPFIAAVQACETIKILAGLEGRLEHSLLWFDLKRCDMQRLKI